MKIRLTNLVYDEPSCLQFLGGYHLLVKCSVRRRKQKTCKINTMHTLWYTFHFFIKLVRREKEAFIRKKFIRGLGYRVEVIISLHDIQVISWIHVMDSLRFRWWEEEDNEYSISLQYMILLDLFGLSSLVIWN